MARVDWNAGEYENSRGPLETLPKGRYLALITDSEIKKTKTGNGRYIEWTLKVISPAEYKGRMLWKRMNVHNPSDTAERIGREEFNSLCAAAKVDKSRASDTAMLHNKVVVANVVIRAGDRGDMNDITGFEEPKPEAQRAAEASARSMASTSTARPQTSQQQPPPKREDPAADTDPDDDIPF